MQKNMHRIVGRMLCDGPFASGVIHMVQNCHGDEEGTHWDKAEKGLTSFKHGDFFCLSCPGASLAPQHGSFVPRE